MDKRTAIVFGAYPAHNIGGSTAAALERSGVLVGKPREDELDVTDHEAVGEWDMNADALVYAPGWCHPDWFQNQSMGDIKRQVDVTLTGAMYVMQKFVSDSLGSGELEGYGGFRCGNKNIVVIGSTAAETPHRGQAAYNAAKAGLRPLIATLARELHGVGFRFFLLEPGKVQGTPYQDQMAAASERMGLDPTATAKRGTLGFDCTPQEVGNFASELVLRDELQWMAGRPIPFSGGPQ